MNWDVVPDEDEIAVVQDLNMGRVLRLALDTAAALTRRTHIDARFILSRNLFHRFLCDPALASSLMPSRLGIGHQVWGLDVSADGNLQDLELAVEFQMSDTINCRCHFRVDGGEPQLVWTRTASRFA